MTRIRWLATTACLLVAGAAEANLPIETSFPVRTTVRIDLGSYAQRATRVYTVTEGDTLAGIATTLLGSATRAAEIAALNAPSDVAALTRGTQLLVPATTADTSTPSWTFFTTSAHLQRGYAVNSLRSMLMYAALDNATPWAPYTSGQEFPDNQRGLRLVAIRTDRLPTFWQRVASLEPLKDKDGAVLPHTATTAYRAEQACVLLASEEADWLAFTQAPLGGRRRGKAGDPVADIREQYLLGGMDNGYLTLELTERSMHDQAGFVLTRSEVAATKRDHALTLFALAGLGLLGLGAVILRRRARRKRDGVGLA
ncbi:MAG: LysM domain-containing protein [Planctomycetota bacterium]|nr:LysM domain-containing protein [Planctomycetota bacterium]